MKNKIISILTFTAAVIILFGCKSKPNIKEVSKQETKGITLTQSWMRPAAMNRNSACFLKIINNSSVPDTLVGVSSDLAKTIQFHLSFKNSNGTMGMKQVFSIPIEANAEFSFKPGAYHIMLIGMNKTMKLKDVGYLTFKFKNTKQKTISVIVKDSY